MDPRRSERVTQVLREELEELIGYELTDPRINVAGIAEVLISPDARHARVRLLMQTDAEAQRQTLEALNHARGYIKRELAHRLDLFRLPELHFEAAMSAELGSRVQVLLKRVRRGRPRTEGTDAPAGSPTPEGATDSPHTGESAQKKSAV